MQGERGGSNPPVSTNKEEENMRNLIRSLIVVLITLAIFVGGYNALADSCWYLARQKTTGNIKCFRCVASNTDPGQGWEFIQLGCGVPEETIEFNWTSTPIFPPAITTVIYATSTPTPLATSAYKPTSTSIPTLLFDNPTGTVVSCNISCDDCTCLQVTESFLANQSLATIAAAQATSVSEKP